MAITLAQPGGRLTGTLSTNYGLPLTIACFIRLPAFIGTNQTVISINDSTGTNVYELRLTTPVGQPNATHNASTATSGFIVDTLWHHIAAVFTSASSRICYTDGIPGTAETTAQAAAVQDNIKIGNNFGNTEEYPNSVMLCGVWDAALTTAEIVGLSSGFTPRHVRSQNLQAYYPIFNGGGNELNLARTGPNLTLTGIANQVDNGSLYY